MTATAMTATAAPRARDPKIEPASEQHKPHELRHIDDAPWETLRYPGQTSKMLFHPRPERPTEPNAGFVRYEPGAHHPLHSHNFAQIWYILEGTFKIGKTGSLSQGSGTEYTLLADWQAATGKDANSISSNPLFSRPRPEEEQADTFFAALRDALARAPDAQTAFAVIDTVQ